MVILIIIMSKFSSFKENRLLFESWRDFLSRSRGRDERGDPDGQRSFKLVSPRQLGLPAGTVLPDTGDVGRAPGLAPGELDPSQLTRKARNLLL